MNIIQWAAEGPAQEGRDMGERELDLRYWTSKRVTRRRMLGGAAAGGAALAAIGLVGCGGDNGNGNGPAGAITPVINDGTQDGPGQPGGILRTRQATALPSMNPFGPGIFALAQQLTLGFTVFDHMWYVPTDTGQVELFLATELEQPDELTVIATIGEAYFHDKAPVNGRQVEAEDIAASYKRFREEAPIGFSWLNDVMEDVVAVDDRTVRITQQFPWAWIFTSSNAGSPISSSILPREILYDHDDLLQRDAIGSSHWVLDGHDNGTNLRFRKFENFRQFEGTRDITGQPFLDGMNARFITDENAAIAAFTASNNEIDTIAFSSRRQMEDTIHRLGDRIVTSSDQSRDYMCLMLKYEPPFTDIRVRQAINLLIDRDEAILHLDDGDALKCGPMPPAHRRYVLPDDDPDLQEYFRTDVEEARQRLEAAGFDFNQQLTIKHSNRPVDSALAQILQDQLRRGGLNVRLVQEDLVRWFSQTLNQGDFQMTCFLHLAYEDPDLPLRFYMTGNGIKNFMNYDEPKVTEAVLAAAQELDEEARVQKVQEAQRVIMSEYSPMMNILSSINFGGRYAYVKGAITGRGSYGLFNRTTWLDKD
jgi:peptide/nickel transport system substrate-binding protein